MQRNIFLQYNIEPYFLYFFSYDILYFSLHNIIQKIIYSEEIRRTKNLKNIGLTVFFLFKRLKFGNLDKRTCEVAGDILITFCYTSPLT